MMPSSQPGSTARRFHTVLVARPSHQRPTEFEVHLRQHCNKIRVHKELSGAHMIFTQVNGLAVRIYYAADCKRLDDAEGTDGLVEFTQRFQWAVTFFVLPDTDVQLESSFVRRAMQLAHCSVHHQNQQPPRFFLVPDSKQAMDSLLYFVDTIGPQRTEQRHKFYQKIRNHNFRDEEESDPGLPEYSASVSTMNQLAERLELPPGESGILLRVFGGIRGLANVERNVLEQVPVDTRTKRLLLELFKGQDEDGILQIMEEESTGDMREVTEYFTQSSELDPPLDSYHCTQAAAGPSVLVDGNYRHPGRVAMGGTPTRESRMYPVLTQAAAANEIPCASRYTNTQPQRTGSYGYMPSNSVQQYQSQQQLSWPSQDPTMMRGHYAPPYSAAYPPQAAGPSQYGLVPPAAGPPITPPGHSYALPAQPIGRVRPPYHPHSSARYHGPSAGRGW